MIIFCTEKNREIDFSYLFLAVLTFSHGLAKLPEVEQVVNWQHGTFNTPLFRIFALIAICALQAWLMLNFITFQLVSEKCLNKIGSVCALNTGCFWGIFSPHTCENL